MKATDLLIQIASEFTGKKAFAQADTATQKLTKNVKTLAKTFGVALGGAALVKFSKDAVKAFVEAEKANTRLANSVKNLGLSFSTSAIQQNLDDISKSAGIAGEVLVDAYQPLLTATGSIIQSQKLLNLALDVSAGTGVQLATVTQDLANAYVGNTRGLRKYNLGLSVAELKSATFLEVQEKLNKQFSGAQAAYLDTYAGKLQVLGEAAGDAQERIGGAVIELGMALVGATDTEDLIGKISAATDFAVARLDNFIEGWKILKAIIKNPLNMASAIQRVQVDEYNRRMARDYMDAWAGVDLPISKQALAQQKAAEAAAKKRAAELAKSTKKNTDELKKQNALKKAATLFDLTQIQIVAALKGKVSDEDRKRLELQLALETGNVEQAQKLTYELAKSQGLTESLAKTLASLPAAKNPFASWAAYLDTIEAQARRIAGMSFGGGASGAGTAQALPSNVDLAGFSAAPELVAAIIAGMKTPAPVVNVTLDGRELTTAITTTQQNNSLSGITATEQRLFGTF